MSQQGILNSLIDYIYVSDLAFTSSVSVGPPLASSDHNCISLTPTVAKSCHKDQRRKIHMAIFKGDFRALNDDLMDALPDIPNTGSDVDSIWSDFKHMFLNVFKHMSSCSIKCRKKLPWFNQKSTSPMKTRNTHKLAKCLHTHDA